MQGPPPAISMSDYFRIGFSANCLALAGVLIMNIATPVEFTAERIRDLAEHHWAGVMLLRLCLFMLVTFAASLPYLVVVKMALAPVRQYLAPNRSPAKGLRERAARRVINLPFIVVPFNLAHWIFIPMIIFWTFYSLEVMKPSTAIAFSIRTAMVGLLSSAIIFFRLESHTRKTLIPLFFPQGRLTEAAGTALLSIKRRLRAFYRMGTLIPLAHILLTLFTLYIQTEAGPTEDFARSVFLFSLIVFCLFFLGSGIMIRMITRSITGPVNEMLAAMDRVGRGDYTTRVAVVSNDEIGRLGDAFNRTIQGLSERKQIREAFGRYVDPKVRDEILAGKIPMDGEVKEVTVMFADLRGFTPLTASQDPKDVVRMLNAYFKAMAPAIQRNQGLILQFLGDEIYAVFGAPIPSSTHPRDAVRAARDMEAALAALNTEFKAQGRPQLSHGIGIHTGQVLAANIGSPDRLSYLLVGDTVNLAARLQAKTREIDARIIVSDDTVSLLENTSDLPDLIPYPGPVRVKGRTPEVKIHLVTG